MTHEYVIAVGGSVQPHDPGNTGMRTTAIAWAADRVLAVGPDDVVRSISRGDSTFLDLGGCIVTALPDEPSEAVNQIEASSRSNPDFDVGTLLVDAGLIDPSDALEPGSPADLAFWELAPEPGDAARRTSIRLKAILRDGRFTEGDARRGPFPTASAS